MQKNISHEISYSKHQGSTAVNGTSTSIADINVTGKALHVHKIIFCYESSITAHLAIFFFRHRNSSTDEHYMFRIFIPQGEYVEFDFEKPLILNGNQDWQFVLQQSTGADRNCYCTIFGEIMDE